MPKGIFINTKEEAEIDRQKVEESINSVGRKADDAIDGANSAASRISDVERSVLSAQSSLEAVNTTSQSLLEVVDSQQKQLQSVSDKQKGFKQFYSGTSTQTITNKTQVLIPHGIPATDPKNASGRTPTLNAKTEAASGYRTASVDATNIIIEYDVAIVSGTDGWVMDWML